MVFVRFLQWLSKFFRSTPSPIAAPSISSNVGSATTNTTLNSQPIAKTFVEMASISAVRSFHNVRPHIRLIKFPQDRPQPNYSSVLGSFNFPVAVLKSPTPVEAPSPFVTDRPPIGSTPRGSGIDERLLPPNFGRRKIDADEIEVINFRIEFSFDDEEGEEIEMEAIDGQYYVRQCRTLCQLCKSGDVEGATKIAAGLVDACRQVSASKNSSPVLNELWAELEDDTNNPLLNEFVASFEHCKSSSLTIFLLRFVDIFINRTTKGRSARLRLVAHANGAQMFLRCLLPFLQAQNIVLDVVEPLIYLLLLIGGVDKKIYMKMRLTGLLKAATDAVCQQSTPSLSLLDLLTVAAQSPLNALTLMKQKELIPSLIRIIDSSTKENNLELTRKCLELAYYVGKTKKNRARMVAAGFITSALDVFSCNFEHRTEDAAMKLCLVSLGLLRLLARTKTGREVLVSANGLSMFKNAVETSLSSRDSNPLAKELDSAVCSACLRCLPPRALPIDKFEFPVLFRLPDDADCRRPAEDNSDSDDDNADPIELSEAEDEAPLGDDPNNRTDTSSSLDVEKYRKFFAEYGDWSPELEKPPKKISASTAPRRSSSTGLLEMRNANVRIKSESENFKISKRIGRNAADPHPETFLPSTKKGKKVEPSMTTTEGGAEVVQAQPPPVSKENYRLYDTREYLEHANETRHVANFVKVAYPDLTCGYPDLPLQPLKEFPNALLQRVLGELEKCEKPNDFETRVVFDLEKLLSTTPPAAKTWPHLRNDDADRVGISDPDVDHLKFESRFESGNLNKVQQVGPLEYELICSSDINQLLHHYQWFYFEVFNMKQDVPYVFKIVNLVKSQSLFSRGMQPVIFSVTEAKCGRPGWARCGQAVVYYRNSYIRPMNNVNVVGTDQQPVKRAESRSFYTASFTVSFRHAYDVCYVAYHYPYTYSSMKANLIKWQQMLGPSSGVLYRTDVLATTLGGNEVALLTITAMGSPEQVGKRDTIFVTSRVHPGEANASWMMHGTIKFLISDHPLAQQARDLFVFKIVPMLNVDGVVNGNHRCSLSGQDLNRQWAKPNARLHPSIFHTKNLLWYLHQMKKTPLVFCDYHGHSRKKNVFVYGNNPSLSWWPDDHSLNEGYDFFLLPEILDEFAPSFSLKYCSFQIQKGKESSARVAIWRQMGVTRCYTMEASYGGFDRGAYAGYQFGTRELAEMGERFVECLVVLKEYVDSNRPPTRKFELSEDDDSECSPPLLTKKL